MNKFILSESERSEILKKHSTYKQYLVENVTNYTLLDLQSVLQTKLGLNLGKTGVDGKFGNFTKAAIIQALDMVKNQVNPVVPVETPGGTPAGTPEGTPEGTPAGTPAGTPKASEVAPDKTTGAADVNLANKQGGEKTSTDSTLIS